jgi:hypothetical protein
LFFSARVFTAVSNDQGTTSARSGNGANGLLGLCTPGPVPMGTGGLSCAPADAAARNANKTTALFIARLLVLVPDFAILSIIVFTSN